MKRFALIIASLALLIGFSQCKKDNDTPNTNDSRIQITLNANYGGNGGRTTFDPANGSFAWNTTETEYIEVGGSESGYLGQLSNTDQKGTGTFNGSITTPENGETLYFFYLGNGSHAGATTVDFSSQDGTLANVTDYHIAIGSEEYTGQTSFSATLDMAMAIAYFDLSGFGSGNVYLNGNDLYSTATINYNAGTISGNSKGYINVGTAGSKYVALIPSVETETTLNFNSSTKTGEMTFLRGIKPASYYSNSGSALEVEASEGSGIPGTFSVSATKKVFFSKGNLQYQASTGTWRFAENQYDAIGNNAGNNNFTETRSTQSDWIDLFGWGTSGWNNSNTYYMPYDYQKTTHTSTGYGPMKNSYTYSFPLTGDYANADWGVNNTISNGGIGWRTLTGGSDGEWKYLLETRNASMVNNVNNARYAKATVCTVNGIILFPDNYSHPSNITLPQNINESGSGGWTNNVYDNSAWKEIEAAGAIFLPITARREESSFTNTDRGYYWSSTNNSGNKAYLIEFYGMSVGSTSYARNFGLAVRLVKDVE